VLEGTPAAVAKASAPKAGDQLAVAQWAIRDARVLDESRRSVGQVHRLTLERYEAHPELEGERLIQRDDVAALTLYYDISGQAASR
jgi:hypothetical protein